VPLLHDCKCAEAGLYTDFGSEEKANFVIFGINVAEVLQKETAIAPAEDFSRDLIPADAFALEHSKSGSGSSSPLSAHEFSSKRETSD
jgi:hypothetical protein